MTLEGLLDALRAAQLDVYAEDVLDALWLAQQGRMLTVHPSPTALAGERPSIEPGPQPPVAAAAPAAPAVAAPEAEPPSETLPPPRAPVYAPGDISPADRTVKASPVALPAGRALSGRLEIARALRPFRKRWPSSHETELDEEATADATADLDGYFYPVVRPVHERWFDVDVVLEDDPAVAFWQDTMRDFCRMLGEVGAFRDVRAWDLRMPDVPADSPKWRPRVEAHTGASMSSHFLDGRGVRRLIFFATHGSSPRWTDGTYARVIKPWLSTCSVVLLQLRPRQRWKRTALGEPDGICHAHEPGGPASRLRFEPFWWTLAAEEETGGRGWLPIVPLQASALSEWAGMQMARGSRASAVLLKPAAAPVGAAAESGDAARDFVRLAASLRESSPQAFRLAVALSSSAFTIPVARLVQEARFGASADPADLGEVLLSGLVFARSTPTTSRDASTTYYDFYPEARDILLRSLRSADAELIAGALQKRMSEYIERIYGRPITFRALVPDDSGGFDLPAWAQPFAEVGVSLLGLPARGRTPHELVESFRSAQVAPIVEATARLAAEAGSERLDRENVAADVWSAIVSAPLVQQTSTGEWHFLPGVAPLLARLASAPAVPTRLSSSYTLGQDAAPQQRAAKPARAVAEIEIALQEAATGETLLGVESTLLESAHRQLTRFPELSQFSADNVAVAGRRLYEALVDNPGVAEALSRAEALGPGDVCRLTIKARRSYMRLPWEALHTHNRDVVGLSPRWWIHRDLNWRRSESPQIDMPVRVMIVCGLVSHAGPKVLDAVRGGLRNAEFPLQCRILINDDTLLRQIETWNDPRFDVGWVAENVLEEIASWRPHILHVMNDVKELFEGSLRLATRTDMLTGSGGASIVLRVADLAMVAGSAQSLCLLVLSDETADIPSAGLNIPAVIAPRSEISLDDMAAVVHEIYTEASRALINAVTRTEDPAIDWSAIMHGVRRRLSERQAGDLWSIPVLYASDPLVRLGRAPGARPEIDRIALNAELEELQRFVDKVRDEEATPAAVHAIEERIAAIKRQLGEPEPAGGPPGETSRDAAVPREPSAADSTNADEAFPSWEIAFNEGGDVASLQIVSEITSQVMARGITDLFVFVHGWNMDRVDARLVYRALLDSMQAARRAPSATRLGALFVLWPSKAWADEDESEQPGQIDEADARLVEPGLWRSLQEHVEAANESHGDAQAVERLRSTMRAIEEKLERAKGDNPDQRTRPRRGTASRAPRTPPDGEEPRGGFSGLFDGAKNALRSLTYWQMRNRAGTVGRMGLGPVLRQLALGAPQLHTHLVAHSVGARVAAHALVALGESTAGAATTNPGGAAADASRSFRPLASVTLLQAILSHHVFSPSIPSNTNRRGILAEAPRLVAGPIVVTYSRRDSAANVGYRSATGVALGDDDAPGESAAERGALGYDGAKAAGAAEAALAPAGTAYVFQPGRIYNIDASDVISGHSDITSREIAWLILSAANLTTGANLPQ